MFDDVWRCGSASCFFLYNLSRGTRFFSNSFFYAAVRNIGRMASPSGTFERIENLSETLDDAAVEKMRLLVLLIGELSQVTSQCRRVQRGSPGAGSLSNSMTGVRTRINQLKPQMASVLERNGRYPGMREAKAQLDRFDSVLNEFVNEVGHEGGYTDRVGYLEKLNYESGTLKGHLEAMIAHFEHDSTHREDRAVDGSDQRTIRRLSFDEDENQPVVAPTALVRDPLYSGGDVVGTVCKSNQVIIDLNAIRLKTHGHMKSISIGLLI